MPGADKQGGTLVLGFYQEPELLNSLIRTQTVASWAGDFLESALIDAAPDGQYYAVLVKEVPTVQNGGVSEDGQTIRLNLNQGYLWEDGDELTCDDVVFTWETYVNPESGAITQIIAAVVYRPERVMSLLAVAKWLRCEL